MSELQPRQLTWAVLLGRWVEFARSAVALPNDAAGRAWKAAVPEIIGLQAVTMALGESHELSPEERALGLDRAGILIEKHTQRLDDLFADDLHPMLRELVADARRAMSEAQGPPATP